MPYPLTSQEKKVLGFLLFLLTFGFVALAVKKWEGRGIAPAPPPAAGER